MDKITIRLGGVPEHFNVPIHLAKEKNAFKKRNIDLQWTDFHGGTGEMTEALRNGNIDACILLTEGIIKDIVFGSPSKIISVYVQTPLSWGVHTSSSNTIQNYSEIFSHRYAISRFGSGSHLMAIVDANIQKKRIKKSQFQVIQNLQGALESLNKGESDVFYWEKFMTKPYVDSGELRRIGIFQSPWSCFVIAARNEVIENKPQALIRMLRTIHDECAAFMYNKNAIRKVQKYHPNIFTEDIEEWFHSTEWAIHGWVSDKMLQSVVYNLRKAGIIAEDQNIPELIWKR